jgi:hypothetical protein
VGREAFIGRVVCKRCEQLFLIVSFVIVVILRA